MNFEEALSKVISLEGGYTLHKNQTESALTYAGIYRKSFPQWNGWQFIDKDLTPPRELVSEFYRVNFWEKVEAADINIRYLLFEFAVNAGLTKAKMIASVINANYQNLQSENEIKIFILSFTIGRIKHYTDLANRNPKKYGIYLRGWVNRALEVLN